MISMTPQHLPIPGREDMVQNDAGGYTFAVNDWQRLRRFLILGSSGTYYATARTLTLENAAAVRRCLERDGSRVVQEIVEVSTQGLAPRNDPALFALAMALQFGDLETRRAAARALLPVARTGTHVLHLAGFVDGLGGWGRLTRAALAGWYNGKSAEDLAYQVVKYQQRDGWSHRDVLRLAHPRPPSDEHNAIYRWITHGWNDLPADGGPRLIWAFEQAKHARMSEAVRLINDYGLTREMIPTHLLRHPQVWEALLHRMPLWATVRNLGKMSQVGLLKPMSDAAALVCKRLRDAEYIRKSRLHPLAVLTALAVYEYGHAVRGGLSWSPVGSIVDALDDAFYLAFNNVEPTGKRILLAIDASASMTARLADSIFSCRQAALAMALITARVEPSYLVIGFTHGRHVVELPISPRQRVDDAMRALERHIHATSTDCTLPMKFALDNGIAVDAFVIYTDSETWVGGAHPCEMLTRYREQSGIPAKLVVVAMVANRFTIGDPADPGTLNVVGFDASAPRTIAGFIAGQF